MASNAPANAGPPPKAPMTTEMRSLLLRIWLVGTSIAMTAAAVLAMLTGLDFAAGVIGVYVFIAGTLVCCYEIHLSQIAAFIAAKCGFMYSVYTRTLFFFLSGILCCALRTIIGYVAGGALFAAMLVQCYLVAFDPRYLEMEYKHLEADLHEYIRAYEGQVAQHAAEQAFRQRTAQQAGAQPSAWA